ncbi:MAG: hypothetical protein HYT90_02980 [Candidatus Omnitrophica bacterium]|nr:hypothetical protein [Candidatus Omnitrophota bacterium]
MKQRLIAQRIRTLMLGACALAFALAVAVPHQHDPSSVSHPAHQCRACKIQDGFSADRPSVAIAPLPHGWVAANPLVPDAAPLLLVTARPSSRAPPAAF